MKEKMKIGRYQIAILILIIEFIRVIFTTHPQDSMNKFFWYIDFYNSDHIFQSFILILPPQLILLILWGDYFEDNIYENAAILFPRTDSVWKLIKKYYSILVIKVMLTVSAMYFIIMLFEKFHTNAVVKKAEIFNMLLYMVYMVAQIVFSNFISMFGTAISGTLVVLGIQVIGLFTIKLTNFNHVAGNFLSSGYIFGLLQNENLICKKALQMLWLFVQIDITFIIHGFMMKKKEWR